MKLGGPVKGRSESGLRKRLGEPLAGALRFLQGIRPCAAQLHDFGPVQEAGTMKSNHFGLSSAPLAQSRCPFMSTPKVERLIAGFDDTAIDGPRNDRRDLAGRD